MIKQSIRIPLFVTQCLDPAFGLSETSDRSAITVVGTSPTNDWYVFEAEETRSNVPTVVKERFLFLAAHYRPHAMSTEMVTAQALYKELIDEGLIALGLPRLTPFHPGTKLTKEQRILKLEPKMRARKIFIHPKLTKLVAQFKSYPQVDHDDLLDSLAQHRAIARPANDFDFSQAFGKFEEEMDDFNEDGPRRKVKGWHTGLGAQMVRVA